MSAQHLAVDCHLHSHWPQRYPYLHPTGSRIDPSNVAASAENVIPALTAHGTTHCVLIQPGAYAFDNRAMMDVIAQSNGSIKAIVTLPLDAKDEDFISLKQQGAVGVRLSLITFDPQLFESEKMSGFLQRCKKHDYYVEVFAAAGTWPAIIPILLKSECKIIAEHIGWPQIAQGIQEPGFKALLDLGRTTDTIIKIQGGFRISFVKPPYDDLTAHVHALLEAFGPDRCVWGSDWPFLTPDHGPTKRPDKAGPVTYPGEQSSLVHWVKDETTRRKILWDNPARFFGFDAEHTMVGLNVKL